MMRVISLISFFTFCCVFEHVNGQISPGKLAAAHADLEGISNCTQCHELGNQVLSSKCLDCHQEIQDLQTQNRGYHADYEVTSRECFDCHSDHHGRNFDMLHFEEDEFDHDLTGYVLEDTHLAIDCKECHKADYIQDADLRERVDTYLGLEQECLSCHADFHQETLSSDCIECHNFDQFRPAPGFDHNNSQFALLGKHMEVDCIECHENTSRNGEEFQVFTGLEFADCVSCHDDAHEGHLSAQCSTCHTEESFTNRDELRNFNHSTTEFKLKGSHTSVNCFDCHDQRSNPAFIFQDLLSVQESNCVTCHEDVHEDKFGENCAQCHQETSFTDLKTMDFFNHSRTDFELVGKHVDVECISCHSGSYIEPIDFSACKNCHEDYHEGDFTTSENYTDCNDCHTLMEGFEYTLFTLEQHDESSFPLEGAHIATPCFECHVSEDRWEFRDMGQTCVECHEDIHQGYISEEYYVNQECNLCHTSDAWSMVTFDHKETGWELEGAHKTTECRDCHFVSSNESTTFTQVFNTLEVTCTTCHENVHDRQFEINGTTECIRCHESESWFPSKFDHNESNFPLDGKHEELECSACHKPLTNQEEVINYKIKKFKCIDCHS
jgi:hypothetical protein